MTDHEARGTHADRIAQEVSAFYERHLSRREFMAVSTAVGTMILTGPLSTATK
jgi:hypothetical protein